jgi:hypothetical protein
MLTKYRAVLIPLIKWAGVMTIACAVGVLLLYLAYHGFISGELEFPRKYSSTPKFIATPTHSPWIFYLLLLVYISLGIVLVTTPFLAVRRLRRATPFQRAMMLGTFAPKKRQPLRILRSLVLFGVIPLIVMVMIMFATILRAP